MTNNFCWPLCVFWVNKMPFCCRSKPTLPLPYGPGFSGCLHPFLYILYSTAALGLLFLSLLGTGLRLLRLRTFFVTESCLLTFGRFKTFLSVDSSTSLTRTFEILFATISTLNTCFVFLAVCNVNTCFCLYCQYVFLSYLTNGRLLELVFLPTNPGSFLIQASVICWQQLCWMLTNLEILEFQGFTRKFSTHNPCSCRSENTSSETIKSLVASSTAKLGF